MKSIQIALLLALLLPVVADVQADSRPSRSSSFKGGFSSQRAAPPPSRSRDAAPGPTQSAKRGGFGAFGQAAPRQGGSEPDRATGPAPAPQKSDSALSQRLGQGNAEANALRTLDARRAAEQAANPPRDSRLPNGPAANGGLGGLGGPGGQGGPMPAPAPVIVQQSGGGGGIGNIITGFLLAKAMSPSHAGNNAYPGRVDNGGVATAGAASGGFGMTVLRTLAWLAIVATIAWLMYFGWKFLRRGKAPSTANYSFERN
ncbi:MAG: hypothetical protein V4754_21980 [Pseudomonadota bacterium]